MKKIVFILLLKVGIINTYGQEFYMYVGGQKRVFEISETKIPPPRTQYSKTNPVNLFRK